MHTCCIRLFLSSSAKILQVELQARHFRAKGDQIISQTFFDSIFPQRPHLAKSIVGICCDDLENVNENAWNVKSCLSLNATTLICLTRPKYSNKGTHRRSQPFLQLFLLKRTRRLNNTVMFILRFSGKKWTFLKIQKVQVHLKKLIKYFPNKVWVSLFAFTQPYRTWKTFQQRKVLKFSRNL